MPRCWPAWRPGGAVDEPDAAPLELPLFPLRTVLFPGGLLPLRIFEPRYVAMVGRCLREQQCFGVVWIVDGGETGPLQAFARIGSSARIVDFNRLPDGLLGLMCRGERRFEVLGHRQQEDGLHVGSVRWRASRRQAVPPVHAPLVRILQEVLPRLGELQRFLEPDFTDADWVGTRLAELLPVPAPVQQRLLELDDPLERLQRLAPLLQTGDG